MKIGVWILKLALLSSSICNCQSQNEKQLQFVYIAVEG